MHASNLVRCKDDSLVQVWVGERLPVSGQLRHATKLVAKVEENLPTLLAFPPLPTQKALLYSLGENLIQS